MNIAVSPNINELDVLNVKRILMVDDSPTERARLGAMLKDLGYDVIEARDGKEALSLLEREQFQLVLSDQVMPEMDGKTLCRTLRSNDRYGSPYVVMLTAENDQNELVTCMDAGADDFLRKPAIKEELRVRLAAGARLVSMRKNVTDQNEQLNETVTALEAAQKQNEQELQFATHLQEEYVPKNQWLSPTLELATEFKTARGIGGDSMGFVTTNSNQVLIYQIDVMGHGVASAMLSFTLQNAIQQMLGYYINQSVLPPLHQIVRRLNERFPSERFSGLYFTMFLGMIDESANTLRYCQAGHPHPCVLSEKGDMMQISRGSFPVGMFDFADFETRSLPFLPGSTLLLSSDGLFDIVDETNSAIGRGAIENILKRERTKDAATQLDIIKQFAYDWGNQESPEDDVSVMLIKRSSEHNQESELNVQPFLTSLRPTESDVEKTLERIYLHLKLLNIDDLLLSKVRTALAELLNNFVEHTVWPEDYAELPIEIITTTSKSWVEFNIQEYSVELPHLCPPKPYSSESESGRGQHIMMSWIDHISCRRDNEANLWRLRFKNS
jgi:sigma-B regulation protein RsbU (phosphoserine phosphatase)